MNEKLQLYDLNKDPKETRNLADDNRYRQVRRELLARLDQIRREDLLGLKIVNQAPPLSPEEKAKLRSIGYVR